MQKESPTGERASADIGGLFADEGPRLWRALYAYCGDRAIADDAVAEAFAQCLRRIEAVREPKAWVWRAAFAIARGQLRERGRWRPLEEVAYEMPDPADRLVAALGKLSRNQRAALILRHYAGFGTDEIAGLMGMSRATVRVHLSRGRRRLRERLEENDEGSG